MQVVSEGVRRPAGIDLSQNLDDLPRRHAAIHAQRLARDKGRFLADQV